MARKTQAERNEDLIAALNSDDLAALEQAIQAGVDWEAPLPDGTPIIHFAQSRPLAVQATCAYIENGGDLELADPDGNTLLHIADYNPLMRLLRAGANPLAKNHDGEPAHKHVNRVGLGIEPHGEYLNGALQEAIWVEETFGKDNLTPEACLQRWLKAEEHQWEREDYQYILPGTLKRLEEKGVFIPKEWIFPVDEEEMELRPDAYPGISSGDERLLWYALENMPSNIPAWMRHMDHAGHPMQVEEWEKSGLLDSIKLDRAHHFFSAEYWADQPSLEPMLALYETVLATCQPNKNKPFAEQLDKVNGAAGDSCSKWLANHAEELAGLKPLRHLLNNLPDGVRKAIPNRHQLITEARLNEQRQQPMR